jgi:hypothetical protein
MNLIHITDRHYTAALLARRRVSVVKPHPVAAAAPAETNGSKQYLIVRADLLVRLSVLFLFHGFG